MKKESVVFVVARRLQQTMDAHDPPLTESALGLSAKVSPRTVANFLRPKSRQASASGKQPSGKLTELEMLAGALKLEVADLVKPAVALTAQERLATYGAPSPWPFKSVQRAEIDALSPKRLKRLERLIRTRLDEWAEDDEDALPAANGAGH